MQPRIFSGRLCAAVPSALLVVSALLGGCIPHAEPYETSALAFPPPSDQRPQDEPVALGKIHYAAGDYGLAERHFREAVERNARSSEAWLGLAAAYDRLARFDLAERAYGHLLAIEGRSPAVLNNLGYHHLLRGNIGQARSYLLEAERMDPGNPLIRGNLLLLATWGNGHAT